MKFGKYLLALALAAGVVSAAPCLATGQDVKTIGSCTIGVLTFSNFDWSLASGSGGPVALSGLIPSNGLNFTPNMNGAGDLHFTFSVSAAPGNVITAFLTNNGLGGTFVQEKVCSAPFTNPQLNGTCAATTLANFGAASGVTTSGNLSTPQSTIWVWKDIFSDASGHLTSFDQSFSSTTVTPEPMTLSMMGAGLLALGLVRRKK